MSKRDREIIGMLESIGLKKIGDIENGTGNSGYVKTCAPNGVERRFQFNRDGGDLHSNRLFMGELRRFVRDNAAPNKPLGPLQLALHQAVETGGQKQPPKKQRTAPVHAAATKVLNDVKALEAEVSASVSSPVPPPPASPAPAPATLPPRLQTATPPPPSPSKPPMPATKTPNKRAPRNVLTTPQNIALADYLRTDYKWNELKPVKWSQVSDAATLALGFEVSINNVHSMADNFNFTLTGRPVDQRAANAIFAKALIVIQNRLQIPIESDLRALASD